MKDQADRGLGIQAYPYSGRPSCAVTQGPRSLPAALELLPDVNSRFWQGECIGEDLDQQEKHLIERYALFALSLSTAFRMAFNMQATCFAPMCIGHHHRAQGGTRCLQQAMTLPCGRLWILEVVKPLSFCSDMAQKLVIILLDRADSRVF